MTTYFGVLEGKGENWGVWFPDIPGCVGAGETAEEAIANARTVLESFGEMDRNEGLLSPAARVLDDLLKDPEVSQAVADGDRLVSFELGGRPSEVRVPA